MLDSKKYRKFAYIVNHLENGFSLQYRWDNGTKEIRCMDLFDEIGEPNCQTIHNVEEFESLLQDAIKNDMHWEFYI